MGLLEIYTDGACSHNGTWKGGWAFIAKIDNITWEDKGSLEDTTNNAMELTAVLKALNFAFPMEVHTVKIYTDSAYISNCFRDEWYVKWMKNGWRNSKREMVANKELWQEILQAHNRLISSGINVEIIKVKGHADNLYNNKVDKLAVEMSK